MPLIIGSKRLLAILLLCLSLSPLSQGQILVDDNFNDNSRSKTGATDLDWYSVKSATTVSMQSDNTTGPNEGGNDGTLQIAPPGTAVGMLVGNFGSTTLAVGQSFVLSLDFRYTTAPGNGGVFRFGLYNSNGSATNSDNSASSNNDFGYRVNLSSSGTPSLSDESGAATDVTSGSDVAAITGGTLSSVPAVSTGSHNVVFTLSRFDSSTMHFGLVVDGVDLVSSGTYSDSTGAFFTFDEIAFGSGGSGNTFRIDNVNLEVVPEPSTYALLGLGLGCLWVLRRRKTS